MNRETLLQILAAADEDKLVQACKAIGIDGVSCSDSGGSYRDGMGADAPSADGLSSWNATKVAMPDSKRPALFNKNDFLEKQPEPAPRTMDKPGSYLEGQSLPLDAFAANDAGMGA